MTINVMDYGADPSGVTDSKAAFGMAFKAAIEAGEHEVHVPRGQFLIADGKLIGPPSGIVLIRDEEDDD